MKLEIENNFQTPELSIYEILPRMQHLSNSSASPYPSFFNVENSSNLNFALFSYDTVVSSLWLMT